MNLPHFDFHTPHTIEECAKLLEAYGNDADLLAGGTDLLVRMKHGLTRPSHLVSLSHVAGLDMVSYEDGKGLVLGARVALAALLASPLIREKYGAIAEAASLVATRQVRHMATLGGNLLQQTRCIYYNRSMPWGKAVAQCFKRGGDVCHVVPQGTRCFAVYQGDLAPVLIALGSKATFVSSDNTEEVPLKSIFTGDGKVPFQNTRGKILTRISIPDHSSPCVVRYKKYRLRNGIDFPVAGVAMALFSDGDTVTGLRLVLTGVWSSPVPVNKVHEIAAGRKLGAALAGDVAHAAYEAAHPLPNTAGNPHTRKSMIRHMVEEMLLS